MGIDKVFAAEIECRHAVFLVLSALLSATARTGWRLYVVLVLSRFVEHSARDSRGTVPSLRGFRIRDAESSNLYRFFSQVPQEFHYAGEPRTWYLEVNYPIASAGRLPE